MLFSWKIESMQHGFHYAWMMINALEYFLLHSIIKAIRQWRSKFLMKFLFKKQFQSDTNWSTSQLRIVFSNVRQISLKKTGTWKTHNTTTTIKDFFFKTNKFEQQRTPKEIVTKSLFFWETSKTQKSRNKLISTQEMYF